MTNVVIVGAGQAGGSAVLQLRSTGFEGEITLLGTEPHPPYERPPLSKAYLNGDLSYESLLLRPESFYQEQGVHLLTGTSVTSLDLEHHAPLRHPLIKLPFDKLLLATERDLASARYRAQIPWGPLFKDACGRTALQHHEARTCV